jgi:cysteine desulfurase
MQLNGHPELRLTNTLNVSFRGVDANTLLAEIQSQVAASAGTPCSMVNARDARFTDFLSFHRRGLSFG